MEIRLLEFYLKWDPVSEYHVQSSVTHRTIGDDFPLYAFFDLNCSYRCILKTMMSAENLNRKLILLEIL